MNALRRAIERGRLHNRIAAIMLHINGYDSKGVVRLASDAGISRSELSRLLHGKTNPSYVIVERIHQCLERKAHRVFNLREIVSETGRYPTTYVCSLLKCKGCLPAYAFNRHVDMTAEFRDVQPGQWTGNVGPTAPKGIKADI